jgi:hypothetical protein
MLISPAVLFARLGPSSPDSGELNLCASPSVSTPTSSCSTAHAGWMIRTIRARRLTVSEVNSTLVVPHAGRPRASENDKQLEINLTQIRS